MIDKLKQKIINSYESGITMSEAEKLAGEFLAAQLDLAETLKIKDLDARLRKSGNKALKSAIRQEFVAKHDKKPTEGQIEDATNLDTTLRDEENSLHEMEVERDYIRNAFDIFKDAHIHFRGIAKGRYE